MSLEISISIVDRRTISVMNITHNLAKMAKEAGIYQAMWHPEEMNGAEEIIEALRRGIGLLQAEPDRFRLLAPKSGWGSRAELLKVAESYLETLDWAKDKEPEVQADR